MNGRIKISYNKHQGHDGYDSQDEHNGERIV